MSKKFKFLTILFISPIHSYILFLLLMFIWLILIYLIKNSLVYIIFSLIITFLYLFIINILSKIFRKYIKEKYIKSKNSFFSLIFITIFFYISLLILILFNQSKLYEYIYFIFLIIINANIGILYTTIKEIKSFESNIYNCNYFPKYKFPNFIEGVLLPNNLFILLYVYGLLFSLYYPKIFNEINMIFLPFLILIFIEYSIPPTRIILQQLNKFSDSENTSIQETTQ